MLALQVLLVIAALQACAATRTTLIRDFPGQAATSFCNNTVGGRWYLADDQGRVCSRSSLDYSTGCCGQGELFSCDTCGEGDMCCSSYAHCVSCCMGPRFAAERRLLEVYRGLNKPETGLWSTPFEYCQSVCRTSSRSTQHENAFILDRRYCFSKQGRPLLPAPPLPPLPSDVTAVVGKAGESCSSACTAAGRVCVAEHLASVNDCNSLREHFPCEAGCTDSGPDQKEFPGYVVPGAPKWQWPALCVAFAAPSAVLGEFNCTHETSQVQRLCTCKEAPQAVEQAQPAGLGGGAAGEAAAGGAVVTPGGLLGAVEGNTGSGASSTGGVAPDGGSAAAAAAAGSISAQDATATAGSTTQQGDAGQAGAAVGQVGLAAQAQQQEPQSQLPLAANVQQGQAGTEGPTA